jgi:uncharacterized membrane protein
MTAAFAPSPWPAPHSARAAGTWRFGRELRFGGAQQAMQWVLRRNCSVTPRQLLGAYLSLCMLSMSIALGFWWVGATVVLAFAGLELLAVGMAMLVFARHAGDRETITLDGSELAVEHHFGHAVRRTIFRSAWVRVEPQAAQGSLVELSGEGSSACVGRYLPAGLRADLAQELRAALRGRRGGEQ